MQCLRDRDQVDGPVSQSTRFGRRDAVLHPVMRLGVRDLLLARISRDHAIEVRSERKCGLTIPGGAIP